MARPLLDGKNMRRLLALLILLSGCDLYFNGDDEPPCAYGDDGYPSYPDQQLRNPTTGLCESWGGGGYCDNYCGPCPAYESTDIVGQPDWGSCYSACEGLDEHACIDTSGCVAAYDEKIGPQDAPSYATFKGCWATPPSGPVQGGGCWELDAQECSRHDDCSMFYSSPYNLTDIIAGDSFSRCGPEPTMQGCSTVDCGPGSHCEEQCYPCDGKSGPCDMPYCTPMCVPDSNSCLATLCEAGYECVEVCDQPATTEGGCGLFPGQCYAQCVPVNNGDPGECTGQVLCDALPPACPANTVAGIRNGCWTGYCIPANDCGPNDPGTCDPAACLAPAPACPSGTTPGVKNGCYTGYCIPNGNCPAPSCEDLTSEAECTAQAECSPVYTGSDCTCYPGGCTCETLVFDRCETWGVVMPF